MNELTVESVQHTLTSVTDELAVATQTVFSRQEVVNQLQRELQNEEQNIHPRQRVYLLGKRQVLQEELQGLQVALCSQAKLQAQQELLQAKLEWLGPGEPPPVPLLQDDRHSTSSSVSTPPPTGATLRASPGCAPHFHPHPPQAWPPADVCPWPQEPEREGGRTPTLEILKSHISGIFRPKFSVSEAWSIRTSAPSPRDGPVQLCQRCTPKPLPPWCSG